MKQIIFLIFCIVLISCNSEKKIIGLCADRFIIKDSIVYIDKYDTIFEFKQPDTLVLWNNQYIHDTTKIKVIKDVVKYREKIVYRENTAKIELLNNDNSKLIKTNADNKNTILELKEKLNLYKGIRNIFIAITIIAIMFYILIKSISKKW